MVRFDPAQKGVTISLKPPITEVKGGLRFLKSEVKTVGECQDFCV